MKIASWNVNSLRVRLPHVLQWLATEQPDILGLQETKLADPKFPAAELEAAGYHVTYSGQPTYNGVALLSRRAPNDVLSDIPGAEDPQRRILAANCDGMRVWNLYVPNGQSVDSDKYAYKLAWLERVTAQLRVELARHPRLVVMGDFNIAPEDRDVHDPEQWRGQVLCSAPERVAFQALLDLGLCDTFRRFEQEPGIFSWWDYRMAAFRRNLGLRIDHILASPVLCGGCTGSRVDPTPRGWERPSDHAPVVAEFRD
ncbi:MAG: exodeoxyribonuclease III [Gammaproteobacteria bacterium]